MPWEAALQLYALQKCLLGLHQVNVSVLASGHEVCVPLDSICLRTSLLHTAAGHNVMQNEHMHNMEPQALKDGVC